MVETLNGGFDFELVRIPNEAAEIIKQLQSDLKAALEKAHTSGNAELAKALRAAFTFGFEQHDYIVYEVPVSIKDGMVIREAIMALEKPSASKEGRR